MKKPHNIKLGETKAFKNLSELQDFSNEFYYKKNEFQFLDGDDLVMKKVN
mgnify:FL=1